MPDRFGNPKVHIGLPSKPLRRPRSASANLDMSMTVQSGENLNEKFRRENAAKREQVKLEINMNLEFKNCYNFFYFKN